MDIERARLHEAVDGIAERFAGAVVDVGLELHDLILALFHGIPLDEVCAKDIRALGVVSLARTKACTHDAEGLRQLVRRADGRRDGCAGRRDVFPLRLHDGERHIVGFDDIHGRRDGNGQHAVLAADGASALGETGDDDIRDPQAVKGDRRGNDIYDGVDGADFMEMHLFQRHVMGERLCFRYDVEHLARQCFRRVCHVCRVDDV